MVDADVVVVVEDSSWSSDPTGFGSSTFALVVVVNVIFVSLDDTGRGVDAGVEDPGGRWRGDASLWLLDLVVVLVRRADEFCLDENDNRVRIAPKKLVFAGLLVVLTVVRLLSFDGVVSSSVVLTEVLLLLL